MNNNQLTSIDQVILYVESRVISGLKNKQDVLEEIQKMYTSEFCPIMYGCVLDGLREKYDCDLYGFEFYYTASNIGFYAKPIPCTQ